MKNGYTGKTLLAIQLDDLKGIGVNKVPLRRAILDEVEKLRVSESGVVGVELIEQSPTRFGRILNQLRLRAVQMPGANRATIH